MDKLLITSNYHYITMACKLSDNIDHIAQPTQGVLPSADGCMTPSALTNIKTQVL